MKLRTKLIAIVVTTVLFLGVGLFIVLKPSESVKEYNPGRASMESPSFLLPESEWPIEEVPVLEDTVKEVYKFPGEILLEEMTVKMDSIKRGQLVYDSLTEIDGLLSDVILANRSKGDWDSQSMFFEYYLNNPLTFENRLKKTEELVFTYTAPDNSFKIWSYDDMTGGTGRRYRNYIQYKMKSGEVTFIEFFLFDKDPDKSYDNQREDNPEIYEVHPFTHEGKDYYLMFMREICYGTLTKYYIAAATIDKGVVTLYTDFFPAWAVDSRSKCVSLEDIENTSNLKYNPNLFEISYNELSSNDDENVLLSRKWRLAINDIKLKR